MSIEIEELGNGRAPHGARGLKPDSTARQMRRTGRAPHGARGLKQVYHRQASDFRASRPAWGAWIETTTESPIAA